LKRKSGYSDGAAYPDSKANQSFSSEVFPEMMKLSRSIDRLKPSPTIAAGEEVRRLQAKGVDVVRFDIGEPDFDTPEHIKRAGIVAIEKGFTHYTSARGIPELREALAEDQKKKGIGLSGSNLVFYPGSKIALFSIMSLLVDPGDEVIIQDPLWPTYRSIVEYLQGVAVPVNDWNDRIKGISFSPEEFERKITPRTKAILVNSPCNPTGSIVAESEIEDLLHICKAKRVPLILDRIYSALTYDGLKDEIPEYDIEDGDLIVTSGFSKEYAMTGWRLGYTIAPKDFTDHLLQLQDNTTTCPASFVQYAAVAALTGERSWQNKMNADYQERRDVMIREMKKIPGWECEVPQGAFYCFPYVADAEDSAVFSAKMLSGAHVSSVAGKFFGKYGENHLRLSYTTPKERIIEGFARIKESSAPAQ
jgi:aspartate aminotransferase